MHGIVVANGKDFIQSLSIIAEFITAYKMTIDEFYAKLNFFYKKIDPTLSYILKYNI